MSSFFTLPASQRKRKRPQSSTQDARKQSAGPKRRDTRDESISGSEASDDDAPYPVAVESQASESEDEEFEDEDPAAKRVRLAEQYLANTQKEVLQEGEGFDAAEIDQENLRRRMGERLKEDTAESKGKIYRWIANDFGWNRAAQRFVRIEGKSVNGVAIQGRTIYTASKDMSLSRWELPSAQEVTDGASRRPKRRAYTRGNSSKKKDRESRHHHGSILCVAASEDGRFVATGGADNKLIVWEALTLKPLAVFTQHRDSVISLAFRRGTNQLFSASKDRTVKIWSLDELAYVETLFGHQDEVVDVSALAQEICVTVGARDRTARLWKVVEESQLVFRGGGAPGRAQAERRNKESHHEDSGVDMPEQTSFHEGSMDRVVCLDDETFITGSDNGSLSVWNIHKKKAVSTYPLAHGLDEPPPRATISAERYPESVSIYTAPQPRYITALCAIPFSNLFLSGSCDGNVLAWRLTDDKRRIEPLGRVFGEQSDEATSVHGIINDLAVVDRGERGQEGVIVVAAVGKEARLGHWKGVDNGKSGFVVFEVSKRPLAASEDIRSNGVNDEVEEDDTFAGFD